MEREEIQISLKEGLKLVVLSPPPPPRTKRGLLTCFVAFKIETTVESVNLWNNGTANIKLYTLIYIFHFGFALFNEILLRTIITFRTYIM